MMYGSIFLLALSLTGQISTKPEVIYDKFKDRTVINMILVNYRDQDGLYFVSLITAQDGSNSMKFNEDDKVILRFSRFADKWKYLKSHDVEMMCGTDHIPVQGQDFTSDLNDGMCTEQMNVYFTKGTLRKYLEKDKDWEVKINSYDPFFVKRAAREKMKVFYLFLDKGKG